MSRIIYATYVSPALDWPGRSDVTLRDVRGNVDTFRAGRPMRTAADR